MDEDEDSADGAPVEPRDLLKDRQALGRFLISDRRPLQAQLEEWAVKALRADGLPTEPGWYAVLPDGSTVPMSKADAAARLGTWKELRQLSGLVRKQSNAPLLVLAARLLELGGEIDRCNERLMPRLNAEEKKELQRSNSLSCRLGYIMAQLEFAKEDKIREGSRKGGKERSRHKDKYEKMMAMDACLQQQGLRPNERARRIESELKIPFNTVKSTLARIAKRHPKPPTVS